MQLDLLRHGETTASGRYHGSTDIALSAAGLQQMIDATRGQHWNRILSSPLQRCAAFASQLSERIGVPLTLDARLREMHFGSWEDQRVADLHERDAQALGDFWRDPLAHAPAGSEPLPELQRRVLAVCDDVLAAQDHTAPRWLLVTHGGPIRILLCAASGHPLRRLLDIDVAHASLHTLIAERDAHGSLQLRPAPTSTAA